MSKFWELAVVSRALGDETRLREMPLFRPKKSIS